MSKKILSIVTLFLLMALVSSCGKTNHQAENSGGSEEWNPEVAQRDVLNEQDCLCGILYMNYSYEEMEGMNKDRTYYEKIFNSTGSIASFPFLNDMPDSQIISTKQGTEVYLIIPRDAKLHVSVYQLVLDEETFEASRGEEMYSSEIGAPFVLQCNYSDLYSDAEIEITDSNGNTLIWRPFISLRDGTVNTETEDGQSVYDFTRYEIVDEDNDD